MLLGGEVAPALLEDVLADLAARGAIRGVEGADGADLLTPAVDAALAVLRGAPSRRASLPPNARPSVRPAHAVLRRGREAATRSPRRRRRSRSSRQPPYESLALSEPPPPPRRDAAD